MHSAYKLIFIVSLIFSTNQIHGQNIELENNSPLTEEAGAFSFDAENFDDVDLDGIDLDDIIMIEDVPSETSLADQIKLGWKVVVIYSKMTKDQAIEHFSKHRKIYLLTIASLATLSGLVIILKQFTADSPKPANQ